MNTSLTRLNLGSLNDNLDNEYFKLVNKINSSLLGSKVNSLKDFRVSIDEKEKNIQEMLSILVKSFLYVDHNIVNWAGLTILHRTLLWGKTQWSVIGIASYAHHLNTFLKDFSGAKDILNIAEDIVKNERLPSSSLQNVFLMIVSSTLNENDESFRRSMEKLTKTSLQNDSIFMYEIITITSLLFDISSSERPSFLHDKIYIISKILEKQNCTNSLLKKYLDLFKSHLDFLTGQKNGEGLKNVTFSEMPFFTSVKTTLNIKQKYLIGEFDSDLQQLELDEKKMLGFFLEAEYLYWSFLHKVKRTIINQEHDQYKNSDFSRKLALLARNSIETIHVRTPKIKMSYLIDNLLTSNCSDVLLEEFKNYLQLNSHDLTSIELAVGYDFLYDFYFLAGRHDDAANFLKLSEKFAVESGVSILESKIKESNHALSLAKDDKPSNAQKLLSDNDENAHRSDQQNNQKHKTSNEKPIAQGGKNKTVLTSLKNLLDIRHELITHLYDLDSQIAGEVEDGLSSLTRFIKLSEILLSRENTEFEWIHHGERRMEMQDISGDLSIIMLLFKILIREQIKRIKINTIVDDVRGNENLIINFEVTFSKTVRARLIAALKEYLGMIVLQTIKGKIIEEAGNSISFEFQIRKSDILMSKGS